MTKRDIAAGLIGAAVVALVALATRGQAGLGAARDAEPGRDDAAAGIGTPRATDGGPAGAGGLAPGAADLGRTVHRLRARLAAVEQNRTRLQAELTRAQELLARTADGGRRRHDFDLGPEEWTQLAKDGTIKFRLPCEREQNWTPGAADLPDMGLTPDEVPLLTEAYRRSYQRSWSEIRALCAQALGGQEAADRLGRNACTHLILDLTGRADQDAVQEAMRQVAEVRAGQRAQPAVADQSPVMRLFLALTGELKAFQDDLARDLGPEAAHQIAFSPHLCSNQSVFGGPGPRPAATAE